MSFKWSTPLKTEEAWLNSDREILGRAQEGVTPDGYLLYTLDLPDGEPLQLAFEKKNFETGRVLCETARETYNERKASKEAASKRKQRDREQQSILDAKGAAIDQPAPEVGILTVSETVSALETAVHGAASLEEEVVQRIALAERDAAKWTRLIEEAAEKREQTYIELEQLRKMEAIFNASKVLEQTSQSVPVEDTEGTEEVHSPTPSTEADLGAGEGNESGDPED